MTELRDRIRGMIDDLAGDVGLVIKDLKDDTTISHREHERFSAASVIKVPILWELFHQVEEQALSLDEVVSVRPDAKVGGTGVIKELHDGVQLTIRDLATLMIVVSDNTATNLIIDRLGMTQINNAMANLGLRASSLQRKMMDFANDVSAWDIAMLLERLGRADGLRKDSCDQALNIMMRQQLNNKLPKGLLLCPSCRRAVKDYPQCPWCYADLRKNPPAGARLAHKTGELAGVEHDVGLLFLDDRAVVIVVLTSNLRNNDDGIEFIGNVASEVARCYSRGA